MGEGVGKGWEAHIISYQSSSCSPFHISEHTNMLPEMYSATVAFCYKEYECMQLAVCCENVGE